MLSSLKQTIGALLFDVPRYVWRLYLNGSESAWIKVKNRSDTLNEQAGTDGVACNGEWTSELWLPKLMPRFVKPLLGAAMAYAPIRFADHRKPEPNPDISIVIGHKGEERLALLLQTLRSIAAQSDVKLECIVVEQDSKPNIQRQLPSWVNYVFLPMESPDSPYSRSKGFNLGAALATSENFIFHDNDMLVPSNYVSEMLRYLRLGYEFVNLKRFIFYLTKAATNDFIATQDIARSFACDSVVQNLLGGGSVGATKAAFNEIGRFDERFVGWGGEDNEFWERASTRRVWSFTNLPIIHLWHSSQPEKTRSKVAPTLQLYAQLKQIEPEQRIRDLTAHR